MSDLNGFKELSRALKALDKKTQAKIVRRGTAKMAQVVRKEMRANVPRQSGKLKKALKYKNSRDRTGGYTATVGAFSDGFYAKFIEKGTKPHEIKSKRGKAVSVGGKQYKSVKHPGQKARPFMLKSFENSRRRALSEAGALMFKLMRV